MKPLRVAIDCRVEDPRQGIWTAVEALAYGLSSLQRTDQTYTFIVPEHLVELLRSHISGSCSILSIASPETPSRSYNLARELTRKFKVVRKMADVVRSTQINVPQSDGTVERNVFDLVHFPTQVAYLTNLPSIYQPWDLQHIHYPQFFARRDILIREKQYRAFCDQASIIAVQTEWGKQDLIRHFGIEERKVRVVRWGSVFEASSPVSEEDIQNTQRDLNLPSKFVVFPAATWQHKNHELVIRSLAQSKVAEQQLHVVFTGAVTEYKKNLLDVAKQLGIQDRVQFVGFVSPKQLKAIFHTAIAMVFPSKFEGLGLPVLEAFHAGLPVICSNATVLPEVVGDAALLFDSDSPEELASLLCRVLESPELRAHMIERGQQMLSSNTIFQTAERFADLYDEIARKSIAKARQ